MFPVILSRFQICIILLFNASRGLPTRVTHEKRRIIIFSRAENSSHAVCSRAKLQTWWSCIFAFADIYMAQSTCFYFREKREKKYVENIFKTILLTSCTCVLPKCLLSLSENLLQQGYLLQDIISLTKATQ